MYASIRVYRNAGSVNEPAHLVDERLHPAIGPPPGYRAYYAVDVDDGVVASVGFFEDPAGAEESNTMAADFMREDLASLLPDPPDIASAGIMAAERREHRGSAPAIHLSADVARPGAKSADLLAPAENDTANHLDVHHQCNNGYGARQAGPSTAVADSGL